MSNIELSKLRIPALKGEMGDWTYYVSLLSFKEVARRVKLPKEIDKKYDDDDLKLGEWIQRKIERKRLKTITDYLKGQQQRFFNSLILGIYDGKPTWQEIDVTQSDAYDNELETDYFSKTIGILSLQGDEKIFAIDGQHRAISIRIAAKDDTSLLEDEIVVIFVAHKTTTEGKERTRRLFSTLNKYAKPVSQSDIIALSEDNNCAIITRSLVEEFELFKDKILLTKTRSIKPENTTAFTNIMVLYDIVERLLTDKPVCSIKVQGKPKNKFIIQRADQKEISEKLVLVQDIITEVIESIPSLKAFFANGSIDRQDKSTSLFFRPIGQNILFDVLKVGIENSKKIEVLQYFAKDDFNLENEIWNKIFWDSETNTINTEKSRQRYVTLLILEHLGIEINRTNKDKELYDNFEIKTEDI
jgi:DNA sulfur modification protein DndB